MKLLQQSLVNKNPTIKHYKIIDSTMSEAHRLIISNKCEEGKIILADVQTKGRGRMGRIWESEKGNLYFSLMTLFEYNISKVSQMSFVVVVALIETLFSLVDKKINLSIKWPNDILLNGKKIAGILLEIESNKHNKSNWLIVGIGLNTDYCSEKIRNIATSLHSCEITIPKRKIIKGFFINFYSRLATWEKEGFASIRSAWLSNIYNLGAQIRVKLPNGEVIEGQFKDISMYGDLMIQTKQNKIFCINTGEVFLLN